jgi:hypothetical protein
MPALYFYGTLIALPKYFMCLVWILSQHSNMMAKIPVINHFIKEESKFFEILPVP